MYLAYRVYRYRGIIPLPSAQSLPLLGSGYSLVTSRLLVRVMLLPWRYQQVPEGTRRTTGVPVGLRGGGTSTRDTSIYTPGNQGKDRHNPPPYVYPPTGQGIHYQVGLWLLVKRMCSPVGGRVPVGGYRVYRDIPPHTVSY